MDERNEPAAAPSRAAPATVTAEQRLALVQAYQTEALARKDALAANLGVIAGDVMGFAHALAATVQASLARGLAAQETRTAALADTELYLKMVRQIDRLAQLERQCAAPANKEKRGQ